MASIRFPGKAMTTIKGYPMFEHVYRRAKLIEGLDDVIVTTCEDEIFKYCKFNKIKVMKSSNLHKNGTTRVAENIDTYDVSHVIILQGDEPLINPIEINFFIKKIRSKKEFKAWNLITKLNNEFDMLDKTIVKCKVVKNQVVELFREKNEDFKNYFKILGIFCFTKETLLKYVSFSQCVKEKKLMIEQIRLLSNSISLNVFKVADSQGSVNIPDDKVKVIEILTKDLDQIAIYKKAFKIG